MSTTKILNTLKQIAEENNLSQSQATIFIKYMETRFCNADHCSEEYMYKWAIRFKHDMEWEKSDLQGRRILKLISPTLYTRSW